MKSALFCLLSLADLLLTWWLLDTSPGQLYEANSLARWCLEHHGWLGLAGFKLACVLTVLGLALAISRHQPRIGDGVLTFACVALAAVVLYSTVLCLDDTPSPELQEAEKARQLNGELSKTLDYESLIDRLSEELATGRLTLFEAAQLVGESEKGRDPAWLKHLARLYDGRPQQECLAANVMGHAVSNQGGRRAAWELAARLEREFYSSYGGPAPRASYVISRQP